MVAAVSTGHRPGSLDLPLLIENISSIRCLYSCTKLYKPELSYEYPPAEEGCADTGLILC